MTKFLAVLIALFGSYYYVSDHYHFSDLAAYAQNHPQAGWAPMVEYYSGVAYYFKGNCPKAQELLSQLLTAYPGGKYEAQSLLYVDDCAETIHDWATAQTALQQYADHFPAGAKIETVTKRLELINNSHL